MTHNQKEVIPQINFYASSFYDKYMCMYIQNYKRLVSKSKMVCVVVSISVIMAGGISYERRKYASAKTILELIHGACITLEPILVNTWQNTDESVCHM